MRLSDIVDETVIRSMLDATRAIERTCAGNPAKLQRQTMRMQTVGEPTTESWDVAWLSVGIALLF